MRVFISWSGERSKEVGELLDDWLQCVLQAINPWMSSKDIDRGAIWFSEINDQLKDTAIGIICLTRDNKEKPWILFESGALAKGLNSNRVCTFLIDLSPTDVEDPLAQFNHTLPDKAGVWSLVHTLNNALGEESLKEKILEKVFETYWPQFESRFKEIISKTPMISKVEKRDNNDILNELLYLSRGLEKRVRTIENNQRSSISESIVKRMPKDEADKLIIKMVESGWTLNDVCKEMEGMVPINFIRNCYMHYKEKFNNEIIEEAIQTNP